MTDSYRLIILIILFILICLILWYREHQRRQIRKSNVSTEHGELIKDLKIAFKEALKEDREERTKDETKGWGNK